MTTEPVIFINCFEVPKGREDEFFAHWSEVNTYMKQKPGFVSNRLHRAKTPNARIRFINYVLWQTEEAWAAAHDDGFRALVQKPEWRDFPPIPAIFEVVSESYANAAAA
jgi:heme-degrading monooxygenase HmoA